MDGIFQVLHEMGLLINALRAEVARLEAALADQDAERLTTPEDGAATVDGAAF